MTLISTNPCTHDYTKCIDCEVFEECSAKEFIVEGKSRMWFPIYMAALFACLVYFLIL
ncbi:MAG: hypothetical protein ACM34J_12255 [Ignavibacteria bacterium]